MLETGDWLNPIAAPTTDVVFLDKPPLKFWIVALPIRLGLLPDNEFGLRFWDAVIRQRRVPLRLRDRSADGGMVLRRGRAPDPVFVRLAVLLARPSREQHGRRRSCSPTRARVYHFLRWADSSDRRRSRRHALAVGLYFLLGFMTKFVAVVFLPIMLAGAALELKPVREKAWREWRAWGLAAVVVVVLAAPWFVYQMLQPDRGVWQIMLGSHVYQRFSASLDTAHLRPWNYYFTDLVGQLTTARTLWVVLTGGLLIHARVLRERWLEGTVALYWFWIPFVLMSVGTSKLRHYTYPFLPPVALAGGYVVASVSTVLVNLASGEVPGWLRRTGAVLGIDRAIGRGRETARRLAGAPARHRRAIRIMQAAALVAAAGFLALAAIALAYPRRLRVAGLLIVRDPSVWRPGLTAVALGLLAGRPGGPHGLPCRSSCWRGSPSHRTARR